MRWLRQTPPVHPVALTIGWAARADSLEMKRIRPQLFLQHPWEIVSREPYDALYVESPENMKVR